MTLEDALPWLREHREELLESIRQGKYKPQPVRRKEIPKPDGRHRLWLALYITICNKN